MMTSRIVHANSANTARTLLHSHFSSRFRSQALSRSWSTYQGSHPLYSIAKRSFSATPPPQSAKDHDFIKNVNEYREMFPANRLPSKELGRQSTSTLSDRFVK